MKSGVNPCPVTIVKVSTINAKVLWKRDLNTVSLKQRLHELGMQLVLNTLCWWMLFFADMV